MERFLWICLAGALGTGTRYLVSSWAGRSFGASFPWGTLFVNVAGCFLIAAIMSVAIRSATFSPNLRLALTTGFLGGLTTYSSFNYETTRLLAERTPRIALLNFVATTVGCLVAGLLGSVVVDVARGLAARGGTGS
jgi:CrcB protein